MSLIVLAIKLCMISIIIVGPQESELSGSASGGGTETSPSDISDSESIAADSCQ